LQYQRCRQQVDHNDANDEEPDISLDSLDEESLEFSSTGERQQLFMASPIWVSKFLWTKIIGPKKDDDWYAID